MYKNGYEPRVGDKVRRLTENTYPHPGMVAGSEWVVVNSKPPFVEVSAYLGTYWSPEAFDLISRAVRYSDGNDAAVGDLVECVKESATGDYFNAGKPGERFMVNEIHPRKDDFPAGIHIEPLTGVPQWKHKGLCVDRFKLIARACPYKVGDWVHCLERQVEFQVTDVKGEYDGWLLSGTNGCCLWRVNSVAPGRLPCPYKIGDWVKSKNSEDFLPEYRNRVFQVTGTSRSGDGPWVITASHGCGTWDVKNVDPAMPPLEPITGNYEQSMSRLDRPLSVSEEIHRIFYGATTTTMPPWLDNCTKKLVDLINAKTSRGEQSIAALTERVSNQAKELHAQNSRLTNQKQDIAAKDAKIQSLTDKNAAQANEIANLLRDFSVLDERNKQKTAELAICYSKIDEMGGEVVDLNNHIRADRETIRALGERLDYKALYENLRNKLREVAE